MESLPNNFYIWLLIAYTLIIIAVIIGVTRVFTKAFAKDTGSFSRSFTKLLGGGIGLRLATVFIVLQTAFFLKLIDKLDEGVLALLTSVAGYVLGGLRFRTNDAKRDEAREPN